MLLALHIKENTYQIQPSVDTVSLGRGAKTPEVCVKFTVHRYKFTQKERGEGKKKKKKHSKREMKNALHGIIDRQDIGEKRFSELEDILIETTETEKQWEKGLKKKIKQAKLNILNCGTTEKKNITHTE